MATGSPSTMRLKEEGLEAVGTTGSGSIGYSSEVSDVYLESLVSEGSDENFEEHR